MASGFHQTIVMGNIGKEPELKYTANGTAVCNFSVAVNDSYVSNGERKERTTWYNVVIWGKQGETAGQYLQKGRPVLLRGKMQTRSWEGPDGGKRYMTELVVDPFGLTFVGRAADYDSEGEDPDLDDEIPFEG